MTASPFIETDEQASLRRIREQHRELVAKRLEYDKALLKFETAKAERDAAKERYEGARQDLEQLTADEIEGLPLFPAFRDKPADSQPPQAPEAAPEPPSVDPDMIAARACFLTEILPPSLAIKLGAAGIQTVGQLVDFTAAKPLTDIDGFGEKSADKVADIMAQWWGNRGKSSSV